jgi:hypothetical protein
MKAKICNANLACDIYVITVTCLAHVCYDASLWDLLLSHTCIELTIAIDRDSVPCHSSAAASGKKLTSLSSQVLRRLP